MMVLISRINPVFQEHPVDVVEMEENKIVLRWASRKTTIQDFVKTCKELENRYDLSKVILSGNKDQCSKFKTELENLDSFKNILIEIKGE